MEKMTETIETRRFDGTLFAKTTYWEDGTLKTRVLFQDDGVTIDSQQEYDIDGNPID